MSNTRRTNMVPYSIPVLDTCTANDQRMKGVNNMQMETQKTANNQSRFEELTVSDLMLLKVCIMESIEKYEAWKGRSLPQDDNDYRNTKLDKLKELKTKVIIQIVKANVISR